MIPHWFWKLVFHDFLEQVPDITRTAKRQAPAGAPVAIRVHNSAYPSGGCPAKLALDADISPAKRPQSLGERVLRVKTRIFQVGE